MDWGANFHVAMESSLSKQTHVGYMPLACSRDVCGLHLQNFLVIKLKLTIVVYFFFLHGLARDALCCQLCRHVKGIVILEEEIPLIHNLAVHVMGM
jgi:hypothetical protein